MEAREGEPFPARPQARPPACHPALYNSPYICLPSRGKLTHLFWCRSVNRAIAASLSTLRSRPSPSYSLLVTSHTSTHPPPAVQKRSTISFTIGRCSISLPPPPAASTAATAWPRHRARAHRRRRRRRRGLPASPEGAAFPPVPPAAAWIARQAGRARFSGLTKSARPLLGPLLGADAPVPRAHDGFPPQPMRPACAAVSAQRYPYAYPSSPPQAGCGPPAQRAL